MQQYKSRERAVRLAAGPARGVGEVSEKIAAGRGRYGSSSHYRSFLPKAPAERSVGPLSLGVKDSEQWALRDRKRSAHIQTRPCHSCVPQLWVRNRLGEVKGQQGR